MNEPDSNEWEQLNDQYVQASVAWIRARLRHCVSQANQDDGTNVENNSIQQVNLSLIHI